MDYDRFQAAQSLERLKIRRCLAPGVECGRKAICAHSIQKARYLQLLQRDGHVVAVRHKFTPATGLTFSFESVGINEATTFTGLCAEHDQSLFAPIENAELDLGDREHLFLLAYRGAIHELHSQMEAASKVQSAYLYRVDQGWDDGNSPSRAGLAATHRMITAYETYVYKTELDVAYASGDFDALDHHVIRLAVERPTIAGNSLYSVDDVIVGNETLVIHLNVLPISATQTVAVFSYVPRFGRMARRHLRPMLRQDASNRMHDLSRMVIDNCGNLVIAPDFFDSWDSTKRDAILGYFIGTAMDPRTKYDSEHFEMFAAPA